MNSLFIFIVALLFSLALIPLANAVAAGEAGIALGTTSTLMGVQTIGCGAMVTADVMNIADEGNIGQGLSKHGLTLGADLFCTATSAVAWAKTGQLAGEVEAAGYTSAEISSMGINQANAVSKLAEQGMSRNTIDRLLVQYGDDLINVVNKYPNGAQVVAQYGDEGASTLKNFNKLKLSDFKWKPNAGRQGFGYHQAKHIDEFADLGITTKQQYSDVVKEVIDDGLSGAGDVEVGIVKHGGQVKIGFYDYARDIFISTDKNHRILTCFRPDTLRYGNNGADYLYSSSMVDWVKIV